MNVRLAIDDFGRGTSSLARLGEMPFAELKLDRSFVADCGSPTIVKLVQRGKGTPPCAVPVTGAWKPGRAGLEPLTLSLSH